MKKSGCPSVDQTQDLHRAKTSWLNLLNAHVGEDGPHCCWFIYLLYTYYIPIIYLLYTYYIPIIYLLYTYYIPIIYLSYTYYIPIIYLLYTHYLPIIYLLYTYYIPIIYLLYTYYTLPHINNPIFGVYQKKTLPNIRWVSIPSHYTGWLIGIPLDYVL